MGNEVAVIRDYDIRDRKLVDATAQSTINSTDAIEMKTTDGNQVFIDKASFIKAVGQAFTASDPKTFTKLLGMNGDGPMGIGASDLASVLGVDADLMRTLRYQRTNGAYIESTDRMLYKNTEWDVSKTVYSVVLITDTLRLRIDPNKPSYPFFSVSNISKEVADAFGLYYTDTASVAKNHLDGEAQTTALINIYNSKGWDVSSLPAGYCRTRFDGRGYLASAGEMDAIYHTYSSILNPCLTAIGAEQINYQYWVSTGYLESGVNVYGWVCLPSGFTYTNSSASFPIQCVSRYD